jgi:hypothetical protein
MNSEILAAAKLAVVSSEGNVSTIRGLNYENKKAALSIKGEKQSMASLSTIRGEFYPALEAAMNDLDMKQKELVAARKK